MAISPQTHERSVELIAQHELGFDILRDPGNAVAAEFGLSYEIGPELAEVYRSFGIDLAASNGEPSWTVPMPARYVLDKHGVVRYARVHPDYTRRPEPEETLAALRAIAAEVKRPK